MQGAEGEVFDAPYRLARRVKMPFFLARSFGNRMRKRDDEDLADTVCMTKQTGIFMNGVFKFRL
jgi:hypothetical protein